MLRIFGCPMFAHANDGKLAPRAIKYMFLGYAFESKDIEYGVLILRKLFRVET